jgi:hypothetical protein
LGGGGGSGGGFAHILPTRRTRWISGVEGKLTLLAGRACGMKGTCNPTLLTG